MRASRGFLWFGGLLLGAVIASATSCAALDSIQAGQCGNRVLENGEDCDSLAPTDRFDGGEGVCGAPNAGAGACRFLCGAQLPDAGTDPDGGTETSRCPTDEVCGSDGICRPDPLADAGPDAQYQFNQLGPPVAAAGRSLVAGDFDGDGLGDVMAVTPAGSELFLGSSKGLTLSSSTELGMHGARAGRLTGDAPPVDERAPYSKYPGDRSDDVMFLFGGGIGVLTGQPGGTLTPAAYPKVDVDEPFKFAGFVFGSSGAAAKPISTPWIFMPVTKDDLSRAKGEKCAQGDLAFLYLAGLPNVVHCFPPDPVSGMKKVTGALLAPIQQDPSNVCSQFVMGLQGDNHVSVYSPCKPGETVFTDWTIGKTVFPILIGAPLAWGPLIYDVDGDGKLDIIAGSEDKMFVAYGSDGFTFASMPGGMGSVGVAAPYDVSVSGWELVPHPDGFKGPVLAVADINGDHQPDFVTPRGLYVSTGPAGSNSLREAYQIGEDTSIESAAFGDFNGDGLTDVALAFEKKGAMGGFTGFPVLEVLVTSSKRIGDLPLLNPNAVSVDAAVFHVVSGDFNGDGLADIAFGQTTDFGLHGDPSRIEKSIDTITVVYGDSGGNFSAAPMGNVLGLGGLVTTDILFPGEAVYDGLSDLGALFSFKTTDPSTGVTTSNNAAAVLPGQPGHLLVAPLGLLHIDQDTGAFTQALPLAVAAGQFDDVPHLDFGSLAVQTDAAGGPTGPLQLWRTSLIGDATATSSTFAPIDVDISQFEAGPPTTNPPAVSASATVFPLDGGDPWFIAAIAGNRQASLILGKPSGQTFDVKTIELAIPPSAPVNAPAVRVEAAKIAGKPTIVVLVGEQLFVVTDFAERSGVTSVTLMPGLIGPIVDFALFPRPAQDESLIVLAAGDVQLSDGVTSAAMPGIDAIEPLAVAVTDVDGDRLPDVVVASPGGLTAFRLSPLPTTASQ